MKRYLVFSLLVLSLFISANAQKLVYGGKPKLFVSKDVKSYHVKFPDGTFVMKFGPKTDDDDQ